MPEKDDRFSRDALNRFLDFAGSKGLMKKATAGAYKTACGIILSILDENEAADLANIDLERIILRHRNLAAGKIPPKTLKTYETRVRAALNNFIEYNKDPSSWKLAVKQRAPRAAGVRKTKSLVSANLKEPEKLGIPSQPSVHIDFQIHISPEATPEQIEQIFASMRRHLYGSTAGK
jgi:hypothetical protein